MTEAGSSGTRLGEAPATAPPFSEEPPANLLLLGPSMGGDGNAIMRLITSAPTTPSLLAVSLLRSPEEQIDSWEDRWQTPPSDIAAIGANNAGSTDKKVDTQYRQTNVADPGDLTGLGIRINECLDAWQDRDCVVVFNSVTTMLQYAEIKQVFQFLHVLTRRMMRAGVMSVFYMDPDAHDAQTVSTISSLFESVYLRTENGWEPS